MYVQYILRPELKGKCNARARYENTLVRFVIFVFRGNKMPLTLTGKVVKIYLLKTNMYVRV